MSQWNEREENIPESRTCRRSCRLRQILSNTLHFVDRDVCWASVHWGRKRPSERGELSTVLKNDDNVSTTTTTIDGDNNDDDV